MDQTTPYSARLYVFVPPVQKEDLFEAAAREGMCPSEWLRVVIRA